MPESPPDQPPQPAGPSPLSYASVDVAGESELVTVARCANPTEAETKANALESAGITAQVVNSHTAALLLGYAGWTAVEVQVRRGDAAAAAEVLRLATADDVEPAGDDPDDVPPLDDGTAPADLTIVAAFDSARALREAATLLESARIPAVLPRLVPRGDHPPGEGKRYRLRVRHADADRAARVLDEHDEADEDSDEPRCPKCGSWRTFPVPRFVRTVLWAVRMGERPATRWTAWHASTAARGRSSCGAVRVRGRS
jgi:hypothetical protein